MASGQDSGPDKMLLSEVAFGGGAEERHGFPLKAQILWPLWDGGSISPPDCTTSW